MRALSLHTCLCLSVAGCGGNDPKPAPIEVLVSSDDSHACAGAVQIEISLAEVNGDTTTRSYHAAVEPEQLDCDFGVGMAEALYSLMAGEISTGRPYTASVELSDSTGLAVGFGASEPFTAKADGDNDSISIQLTRIAPLGTVLLDLIREPAFVRAPGDLDLVVLVANDPIGSRSIRWPGDDSLKRPLRISGLAGMGLRLLIELTPR